MIDSHCHLADEAFSSDIAEVVERAAAAGVDQALCILDVTNEEELVRAGGVVRLWPAVQFAAGVHPHQAGQFKDSSDEVVPTYEAALKRCPNVCAVGEIGLDLAAKTKVLIFPSSTVRSKVTVRGVISTLEPVYCLALENG